MWRDIRAMPENALPENRTSNRTAGLSNREGRFAGESSLSSVYDRRAEPSRRDIRVDDRAVALDDLLNAAPLQLPRDRRAVEAQHPRDVFPGLGIWRDTAGRHPPLLARVVRRGGERQILAGTPHEAAPMAGAPGGGFPPGERGAPREGR